MLLKFFNSNFNWIFYDSKNPVEIVIKKFEQHPGINLIKKNITNHKNFHFSSADHENILKDIINIVNKKWNF